MTVTFQGGRLRPTPTKPRLWLSRHLTGAVPAPATADWLSKVQSWPMGHNDSCGDCTIATEQHAIEIVSTYGQGKTTTIGDDVVLAKYEALSGYDPATGANDTGLVVQDVLNDWVKNGIGGHKALAFAQVDLSNAAEVKAAIAIFGWVYLGINFPASAMDQFNAGKPWDVVKGARIEGGHAVPLGYYDSSKYKAVTWGRPQDMTLAFFQKYAEECWAVITPEWLSTVGTSPTGLDLYGLGQDLSSITGRANPFPKPQPQPTPSPTPAPTPKPSDPDSVFAMAAKAWLAAKHF
jgi:hypothetical protein